MRMTRQSVQSSRAVLIFNTGTRTNYLLPMVAAVHVGVLLQTNTVSQNSRAAPEGDDEASANISCLPLTCGRTLVLSLA